MRAVKGAKVAGVFAGSYVLGVAVFFAIAIRDHIASVKRMTDGSEDRPDRCTIDCCCKCHQMGCGCHERVGTPNKTGRQ